MSLRIVEDRAPVVSREQLATIRDHLRNSQPAMLSLARALVEIESPSGDEAGSRDVVSLLAARARGISAVSEIERVKYDGYGEHLIVRAFGNGSPYEKGILLLGHTDTVHERGSLAARPWRQKGEQIFGPGIFDMKANCALALEVLRTLVALDYDPSRTVTLLLTCDEEAGSMTGRALVEAEAKRAQIALILEPPAAGGAVKTGRKGTGSFAIQAEGIAAHAGLEPEKGASAILEMARQIEVLHALNDPERGTTLNVGVVSGGTRSNVVAAEAECEIDVRFATTGESERISRTIRELKSFDPRVRLKITGGINRPPLERSPETVALFDHAKELSAAMGLELRETQVGGASDGNFVGAMGVPVLDGLGIEGDGAHADHEHIVTGRIAERGALIAGLIMSS
jgi:glutamate carboxypeptidase